MSKARVTDQGGGEKQFVLKGDDDRVVVHPWSRRSGGVYISVGDLDKTGTSKSDDFVNIIVDRNEFVSGLLAVFPELRRSEA